MVDWTKVLKGEVGLCLGNEILLGNWGLNVEARKLISFLIVMAWDMMNIHLNTLKELKKYRVSPQSRTGDCLLQKSLFVEVSAPVLSLQEDNWIGILVAWKWRAATCRIPSCASVSMQVIDFWRSETRSILRFWKSECENFSENHLHFPLESLMKPPIWVEGPAAHASAAASPDQKSHRSEWLHMAKPRLIEVLSSLMFLVILFFCWSSDPECASKYVDPKVQSLRTSSGHSTGWCLTEISLPWKGIAVPGGRARKIISGVIHGRTESQLSRSMLKNV